MLINAGLLALGILLGWIIFGGGEARTSENESAKQGMTGHDMSMEPEDESAQFSVKLSDAAMKIAEVAMTPVEKKVPYKEVYLPGKVMPDERKIAQLTARYPGRIEKLHVNFTGQKVRKGEVLASIYSPDLVTAQRELFEAMKFKDTNFQYYDASRQKLKLWSLTEEQIDNIEKTGEVKFYFDVLSPLDGTVTKRNVALGDYVSEGNPLFEIINLSHLWVMFDAYENDLPWIKMGDKIRFTIKSLPNEEFAGRVTFIDPVIDKVSRVTKVRVELENPRDLLKPEMLASGILRTMLPRSGEDVVIPKSAVLWTGKKAIVYVMTDTHNNMFEYREVALGSDAGNYWVVKSGLKEGEMVVSNGVFKIDAAVQLKGEKSMMNPEGGKIAMGHAGMDMGGDKKEEPGDQNASKKTQEGHKGMSMDMGVNDDFKKQFTEVCNKLLLLDDAFIASDAAKAKSTATDIEAALAGVDMGLLKGDMMEKWMASLPILNEALNKIKSTNDIEKQRLAFADFNDEMYKAVKTYGTSGVTIYYQYCPMARDGRGAYWLSGRKEIKNPFFGKAMLTCGETKEIIK